MNTVPLLDEPYTFTQFRPLLPKQFIDEAKGCGVWLSEQELEALVTVTTWTRTGTSFEFAHFTDAEIAAASARLDRRQCRPTPERRLTVIVNLRSSRGNLDELLGPISKVALADALWPTLEAKIERALARRTERRIPIVCMVDQAAALAHELPRRNLVIALERPRQTSRH